MTEEEKEIHKKEIETVKVYNQSCINKQQKRIAEQEELLNSTLEENKDIYKKMADLDTALEDCTESLTDARIKIKELEKENEELKEKLEIEQNARGDWFGKAVTKDRRLTEAKALLTKWVELFKPKGSNIPPTPIQVDTEQFLKEVK